MTRNAVLASPEHRFKGSLRSPLILPKVALVDPELTYGLPPAITASTGLDALTQLIEPYTCCRTNPMVDALCIEGIRRAARSLRVAFADGQNTLAREDLCVASLFGGLALAIAGLGAVHGFAAPIGGMFSAPHGAVSAVLLPHVMAANLRALRSRGPKGDTVRRYDKIARLVTGNSSAKDDDGVRWDELLRAQAWRPEDTNSTMAMFARCTLCADCLDACPLYDGELTGMLGVSSEARQKVHPLLSEMVGVSRWLAS